MSGKSKLTLEQRIVRNQRIADEYRAGATLLGLAKRHSISHGAVFVIVRRVHGPLTPEERRERQSKANRAIIARPGVRERISRSMKLAWAEGRVNGGRPAVFADDPAKRHDYLTLRKHLGAAEARKLMGIS